MEILQGIMEHCIGLDNHPTFRGRYRTYEAYRNYYTTSKTKEDNVGWEKYYVKGYCVRLKTNNGFYEYKLTDRGCRYLENKYGIKIKFRYIDDVINYIPFGKINTPLGITSEKSTSAIFKLNNIIYALCYDEEGWYHLEADNEILIQFQEENYLKAFKRVLERFKGKEIIYTQVGQKWLETAKNNESRLK